MMSGSISRSWMLWFRVQCTWPWCLALKQNNAKTSDEPLVVCAVCSFHSCFLLSPGLSWSMEAVSPHSKEIHPCRISVSPSTINHSELLIESVSFLCCKILVSITDWSWSSYSSWQTCFTYLTCVLLQLRSSGSLRTCKCDMKFIRHAPLTYRTYV